MKITVPFDCYKGADGSSLSDSRCTQIIEVYEMLESMENTRMDYLKLQEEADKRKLFGNTKTKNAIRTFFPLLKKLHFVNYEGTFKSTDCFSKLGEQFVFTSRALFNIREDTPHKEEIERKLKNVRIMIIRQGLINMNQDPDYSNHNIWIALKMLFALDKLHWNEFVYMLYRLDSDYPFDDTIQDIKKRKEEIDEMEFLKENGTPLPNTCYSYIRSLLEEALLIENAGKNTSKIIDKSDTFYTQLVL